MTVVSRTLANASSSVIVKGVRPVSLRVRVVSGMPVREATSRRERSLASMRAATSLATAAAGVVRSMWSTLRATWRDGKTYRRLEDGTRVIDVTQLDKLARVFGMTMPELARRAIERLSYVDVSTPDRF